MPYLKKIMLSSLVLLTLSSTANAIVYQYQTNNVIFENGFTMEGTFSYDNSSYTSLGYDLTVFSNGTEFYRFDSSSSHVSSNFINLSQFSAVHKPIAGSVWDVNAFGLYAYNPNFDPGKYGGNIPSNISLHSNSSFSYSTEANALAGIFTIHNKIVSGSLTTLQSIGDSQVYAGAGIDPDEVTLDLGQESSVGTLTVDLPATTNGGEFTGSYEQITFTDFIGPNFDLTDLDFLLPGDNIQLWDLHYEGDLEAQLVDLIFNYDDTGMTEAEELSLAVWHNHSVRGWEMLSGTVDIVNNKITTQTDSFSNFAVLNAQASVPTPTTLALMSLGLAAVGWTRRKK